ncbi:AAA domain-containing protein [Roseovarius azorensis]|uniref:AAA domain-containing protein n=1 Tax=Roseovarius azorensis TaxID=1287727 RepID=A0A1H7G4T0_9RHOB|nr:AAA family ATPase [Roseovarius azorensis]SEK33313.1 AAA domain-containing protein [Roseovarius azorensis]
MTPSIAPLRNVAALIGLIERVQTRAFGLPGMATFYGPSGWGKTTAVTVAANEYQAHVVQVKDCWTPTYFAQAVLREIGLPPVRGVAGMVDAIGAQLARTDRPLIIDDAQYLLRKRMIELARDIYESCQAPIILVGEEKLPQDLTRWENIHNRQLAWEPALACNISDAQKLALIYAAGIDVADDLLGAIVDASGGSIRRVAINLAHAREIAQGRGRRLADMELWGNRIFETGQPPAVRRVEEYRAPRTRETVVPLAPEGKAVRA